ncbi:hypothetical protein BH11BAC2_BH11BAC2_24110 [soil metagenome]
MYRFKFLLLAILFISKSVFSQTADQKNQQLYNYAVKLQQDGKFDDALTVFKNLLKSDSSNVAYLHHAAFLYAKSGFNQPTEKIKTSFFNIAEYLSLKAIAINPKSADAHYTYALTVAGKNEFASNRSKIENARLIKTEAETAIRLNPKLAGPYHVLGRWHQALAGFNSFERGMIKAIFGGLPGGSYDDAIKNFEMAILLEPLNGLHYYQLAISYHLRDHEGDNNQAINWLKKGILIQIRNDGEIKSQKDMEDLLKKLSSK